MSEVKYLGRGLARLKGKSSQPWEGYSQEPSTWHFCIHLVGLRAGGSLLGLLKAGSASVCTLTTLPDQENISCSQYNDGQDAHCTFATEETCLQFYWTCLRPASSIGQKPRSWEPARRSLAISRSCLTVLGPVLKEVGYLRSSDKQHEESQIWDVGGDGMCPTI